ncbi:hypothetical protein VTK73DRAFT_8901 [Phialemonium thermophilum]|uniref:Uncharacterized protein n=1 Tax=Phialemonium thermophilum TaxID=223376 RepID=A0ABR3XN90_9PEZI
MAPPRVSMLRHLTSCRTRSLRVSNQRRWAQVHDVRFLATTQQPLNVLEKYREKLDRKAREEGHQDIESLKKAYAEKIQDLRKRDAIHPPPIPSEASKTVTTNSTTKQTSETLPLTSSPAEPTQSTSTSSTEPLASARSRPQSVRPLSSMLDLTKARTLPAKELTAVWRLRHASSPRSLCAVIPAHTYAAMELAARRTPQFVLPVPHPEQGGAEIHFLQWTFDEGPASGSTGAAGTSTQTSTVLFTQLAEYKARGEFAQPHTSITHHLDLAADKGVVLMEGTVMEGRGISVEDARWLVVCLQRFYGGWDGEKLDGQERSQELARERMEERRKLLEWFGKGDSRFSVEKLMEEAERMG